MSFFDFKSNTVLFYFDIWPPFFEKESQFKLYDPGPTRVFLSTSNRFTVEKMAPFLPDYAILSITSEN